MANELSGMIERQETGVKGFFQRAKKKRAKSKAIRMEDRNRIQRIRTQEQKKLERSFIRKQEKEKLAKKFKVKRKTTIREGFLFGQQPEVKRKKPAISLF